MLTYPAFLKRRAFQHLRLRLLVPVEKANGDPPHISASLAAAVKLAKQLAEELRGYGEKLAADRLESVILTGNVYLIEQVINFANLAKVLTDLVQPELHEQFLEGAKVTQRQLANANLSIRFNAMDPRAVAWAAKSAGKLVTEVTESQKQMVSEVIRDAQAEGHTPKQVAKSLRTFIGLRSDQVKAINKYRDELVADETAPTEVARLVDKYAGFLLRDRTDNIARTELLKATHEGQLQALREGISQGTVNPSRQRRKWFTAEDERVCPICEPMDGKEVDADEPWQLEDGTQVWVPTDAHPRCRCSFALVTSHGEDDE